MTLVRLDPFRDLVTLQNRLNQAFSGTSDSYGTWVPAVDIFERGDELVIRMDAAGVDKDDIELNVENNVLTIHGERKREAEFDENCAYRLERTFGTFLRSFSLPKTVDATKIAANYKNGVLEVTLPKAPEAKPRKIGITVS